LAKWIQAVSTIPTVPSRCNRSSVFVASTRSK
jgi:hypothetical protein